MPEESLHQHGEIPFQGEGGSVNDGDDLAVGASRDCAVDDDVGDEVLSIILDASSPHALPLPQRPVHSRRSSLIGDSAMIQLSVEGSGDSDAISDPGRAESMPALLDLGMNEPTAARPVLVTDSAISTAGVVKSALSDSTIRCPLPLPGKGPSLGGVVSPCRGTPPDTVDPLRSVPFLRDVESLRDDLLGMAPLGAPLRPPLLTLTSPQALTERKEQRRTSPLTTPVRHRARSLPSREIQSPLHVDNSNNSPIHSSTPTTPFWRRVLSLSRTQTKNSSPTSWRHGGHGNSLMAWIEGSSASATEGPCLASTTAATRGTLATRGDQAGAMAAASSTCNPPRHAFSYSSASSVSVLSSNKKIAPPCSQRRGLLPQQGKKRGYGLGSRGGSIHGRDRRTDTGGQGEERWVRSISADSVAASAGALLGESRCLLQGADRVWSNESKATVVAIAAATRSLNGRAVDIGGLAQDRADFSGCSSYVGDGSDSNAGDCVNGAHTTPAAHGRHPSSTSTSGCSDMAPAVIPAMSTQPSMPSPGRFTGGTNDNYSSGIDRGGHGTGGSGIAAHEHVTSMGQNVGRREDGSKSASSGSGEKGVGSSRFSSTKDGAVLLPFPPCLQPRSRIRAHDRGRRSTSDAKPMRRYRSASPRPFDSGNAGDCELYHRLSLVGSKGGSGEREHQRGTLRSESQSLRDYPRSELPRVHVVPEGGMCLGDEMFAAASAAVAATARATRAEWVTEGIPYFLSPSFFPYDVPRSLSCPDTFGPDEGSTGSML